MKDVGKPFKCGSKTWGQSIGQWRALFFQNKDKLANSSILAPGLSVELRLHH